MNRNRVIRNICIAIIIIVLLLLSIKKCKHDPEPDPTPKPPVEIIPNFPVSSGSVGVGNSTKILTYDTDTYIDTCNSCQRKIRDSGWNAIRIEQATGLFSRIRINNNNKISELDMVVHSIPGKFGNYFNMNSICVFADSLKEIINPKTVIYLNGCNTGVETFFYDRCLGISSAQRLANLTGCTVYGSKGYLEGSYAENSEVCSRCIGNECPGEINASGHSVWRICQPSNDNCTCLGYIVDRSSTVTTNFIQMKQNKSNLIKSYAYPIRPFPDFQLQFFEERKGQIVPVRYYVYVLERLICDQKYNSIYSFTNNELHLLLDSLSFYSKEME